MIKSIYNNQKQLMKSLCHLHIGDGFDLDPTFNKGLIHDGLSDPVIKSDLHGHQYGVSKCDCRELPFADGIIKSIMFDPPFLAGGGKTGKMNKRYTSYKNADDLLVFYNQAIVEFHRVLKKGGKLVFKCQDLLNGRVQTMTHCEVYNMAIEQGFYARDLFILVTSNRAKPHNMKVQEHARKHHTYFWVFEKCRKKNKRLGMRNEH